MVTSYLEREITLKINIFHNAIQGNFILTFIKKENLSNFTLKKEFCLLKKKHLSKRGFYLT